MKKLLSTFLCAGILHAGAQQFSLIKDINPGSATSNICYITEVGSRLFFGANNGTNGMELWQSDGTSAGTFMIKDINTGSASSSIGYLTNVGGTLYFVANNGASGTELWKSDGTAGGTVIVKDIRPGSLGSNPSELVAMNGILYFSADDGINGAELWKSDGTAAGTVMVKDINPGSMSGRPQSIAGMNGSIYFSADDGNSGTELWKSDGTDAGTYLLKDLWAGPDESYPYDLTSVGYTVYFAATGEGIGTELWRTDGTAGGTFLVKDVWSGNSDSYPFSLKNIGGTLFFSADNGSSGIELWKSDGTAAGTMLVKDVWPGEESGSAGNFSQFINKLLFTGNDGVSGNTTWQSDGTAGGTIVATGLASPSNGEIIQLVETPNKLFASIQETSTGKELWGISYSSVLPLRLLDFHGRLAGNNALLEWKTVDEQNVSLYIIERSTDNIHYEEAGRLNSRNQSSITEYDFVDPNVTALNQHRIYYRLKMVDIDSRFRYSPTISISVEGEADVRIYPNPAVNHLTITGNLAKLQGFRIFDNNGKLILVQSCRPATRSNTYPINVGSLPSGIYFIDFQMTMGNKVLQFAVSR